MTSKALKVEERARQYFWNDGAGNCVRRSPVLEDVTEIHMGLIISQLEQRGDEYSHIDGILYPNTCSDVFKSSTQYQSVTNAIEKATDPNACGCIMMTESFGNVVKLR